MESCTVWITEIPVHFSKNAVWTECQNKTSKWVLFKIFASCFVSCCCFASSLHQWDGCTARGLLWWKPLAHSVPFPWWKVEVPGQMRRTCTSSSWSLRARGSGGEQAPAVPAHLLPVRARSWPRAPASQLQALPPALHDNSGSRQTAAPSQMLPCTWALIRWRFPLHRGVGNFAWLPWQKCVAVGMGVGKSRVAKPDTIALAAHRGMWALGCRNVCQFLDRAKHVGRAEKGEVCLLFCPHTVCDFLFMSVPRWNWGAEAVHRSGTN